MNENTAYLDHNILDALVKGRLQNPPQPTHPCTFVYSNETMNEIRRSSGYEHKFLGQLYLLDAKCLVVGANLHGALTGEWHIEKCDPYQLYKSHIAALAETPGGDFGLNKFIQKIYGGLDDESFSDIGAHIHSELKEMLESVLEEAKTELTPEQYEACRDQFAILIEKSSSGTSGFEALDSNPDEELSTTGWESEVGAGPKQLKNIQGPRAVEKVYEAICAGGGTKLTLDELFGLDKAYIGLPSPTTTAEKCNAIYHGLNFVGYYRDKGMKRLNRVVASNSDMTHVGYASYCRYLITADHDLSVKAQAVYEHLNVETQVIYSPAQS